MRQYRLAVAPKWRSVVCHVVFLVFFVCCRLFKKKSLKWLMSCPWLSRTMCVLLPSFLLRASNKCLALSTSSPWKLWEIWEPFKQNLDATQRWPPRVVKQDFLERFCWGDSEAFFVNPRNGRNTRKNGENVLEGLHIQYYILVLGFWNYEIIYWRNCGFRILQDPPIVL